MICIAKQYLIDFLRRRHPGRTIPAGAGFCCFVLSFFCLSCTYNHLPTSSTGGHDYLQVNLVADTAGFDAARIDTNLHNPWGISIGKTGSFWIACNRTGLTVIYDENGVEVLSPIAIPYNSLRFGSAPTGTVFNPGSDFTVNGKPSRFIYATENGTLAAWSSGDSTTTVTDRSSHNAVYKGLTLANDGTGNFIYVADFFNARIDVFDRSFNLVTNKLFVDPTIPPGFAPFNIKHINGKLYVAYAKQEDNDKGDDQSGPGNGYVSIFNPDGSFVKRFASQAALNSPWGIEIAPAGFGQLANAVLIGNFGDGRINVFDTSGQLIGPLENDGVPIVIPRLWDIAFYQPQVTKLYFTAGPVRQRHGLFGYLKVR